MSVHIISVVSVSEWNLFLSLLLCKLQNAHEPNFFKKLKVRFNSICLLSIKENKVEKVKDKIVLFSVV